MKKIKKVFDLDQYTTYEKWKRGSTDGTKHSTYVTEAAKQVFAATIPLQRMESFIIKNVSWYESSVKTAFQIITKLASIDPDFSSSGRKLESPGWQKLFYVRGAKASKNRAANAMENIEALFKVANKNQRMFGDVNKWSPADIYFVSQKADKKIDEELTTLTVSAKKGSGKGIDSYKFYDLNKLCNGLLDSGDLLPLSLKKVVTDKASLHNYNFSRSATEKQLANIEYHSVSSWASGVRYTPPSDTLLPKLIKGIKLPNGRVMAKDIKIYFNGGTREKIQIRHVPYSEKFTAAKSLKAEVLVTGAGGRAGSATGIYRITEIIKGVDPAFAVSIEKAFDKGFKAYVKDLDKLNEAYEVKSNDSHGPMKSRTVKDWTVRGDVQYEDYSEARAHLSGIHISNNMMPVIYDWFNSNGNDPKTRILCSRVIRNFVEYATSRSVQSGMFVIAK